MDPQELVTGVRWELLKRVASHPASGGDLAKLLGTSAANISQHLKLLELAGLVTKERVNGKTVHYKIVRDTALLTLLVDPPVRVAIPLHGHEKIELQLLTQQSPCSRCLRRFLLQYEDLVQTFMAFGIIKESEHEVQLLVIAEDVKQLRKEYANIQLGNKRIVIWSHTPKEVEDGLHRKEPYFIDMFRHLTALSDPNSFLQGLKEALR